MGRARRPLAAVLAATAIAAATAACVVSEVAAGRGAEHSLRAWALPVFLLIIGAPVSVGLFVAWRRPRNVVAWILIVGPTALALLMCADAVAGLALHEDRGSAISRWATLGAQFWPIIFLWPLALAFVYPDGKLPSPRWRPVAWAVAVNSALMLALLALADPMERGTSGELIPNPLPITIDRDAATPIFWVTWFVLVASLFAGAAALRARYRAGDAIQRRQVLWLAYGVLLLPIWLGGGSLVSTVVTDTTAGDGLVLGTLQIWPAVAVAIAVTRHGLYGIDRLFNRTLVYLTITLLLAASYGIVALLVGTVAGDSALTASIATLAAALLFRPARDRVQGGVDRRFARARFDAVRQLREFVEDVRDGKAEPEDVGEALAVALGDPTAEVVFQLPETSAYADREGRLVDELPDDGRDRSVIARGDHTLGVLLHSPKLTPERDLLRSALAAAAVPVELARLRVELRLQLAEVESSRARIAEAGYAERRRLERDLHDGAQQRLVTLGIMLRRLQRSLPKEARVLSPALDSAVDEVSGAIGDLRTIAAGVRPPRLDEGLAAALEDLARGSAIPVEITASADRAPPEVEAAAYYVACEALTNAVKHGSPTRVGVATARANGVLRMEISDDGVGGASSANGSGLAGMRDRVAAHGGTLAIDSPPGAGTRISVELPCGS